MVDDEAAAATLGERENLEFALLLHRMTPRIWVTPLLVLANAAVWVVMVASGVHFFSPTIADLLGWGANYAPLTTSGEWWRLESATFIHIGLMHIAFNMYVLWDAGRLVERVVGNLSFLVMYVLSGLAGSLASTWWNPYVVSAGASGAVFGVFGCLLGVLVMRRGAVPRAAVAGIAKNAGLFVLYNVAFGLAVPGIDMAAHLGGLAGGFVCGLGLAPTFRVGAPDRRSLRAVAVSLAGAAALYGAAMALPAGLPDLQSEIEELAVSEKKVLTAYSDLVSGAQSGRLTDSEFADGLEKDVIPGWASAEARFRALDLSGAPEKQRTLHTELSRYLELRGRAWQLLRDAARGGDEAKMQAAAKLQAEAEAITQKLGGDD
jgi:rhomboid protease GluP